MFTMRHASAKQERVAATLARSPKGTAASGARVGSPLPRDIFRWRERFAIIAAAGRPGRCTRAKYLPFAFYAISFSAGSRRISRR